MNTKDTLLVKIIESEMRFKGITNYRIKDVEVKNPKLIEIKTNQAIYIYGVRLEREEDNFTFRLDSPTASIRYQSKGMNRYLIKSELPPNSNLYAYQSDRISSHWASLKVVNNLNIPFFMHYVLITYMN